jgi:hypothetical protein
MFSQKIKSLARFARAIRRRSNGAMAGQAENPEKILFDLGTLRAL